MEHKDLEIVYCLEAKNRNTETFRLLLDGETLALKLDATEVATPPPWTALGVEQCGHCPLDPATTPHCPFARALERVVQFADRFVSYDEVTATATIGARVVTTRCPAQGALSSIIGLISATSGCPYTAYLRPMARFHLPFGSTEETVYRIFSMYLLAQYFRKHQGLEPDFDLGGLRRIYEDIEEVNIAMANRLQTASRSDASLNAVIILDSFAKTALLLIDDRIDQLEYLFGPYMKET